ncbi:dual specificity phosphatase [Staphylotrichum tortipilum]|uniref:Dual specificity phosphatase n=1 Tax=Staphylotrichum tortipilum TaxID=2831512 RepID=A0AAN6MMW9_9PEZI|nr:dual specificity phosphatase [Staphylotrichum longicolle]
METISATDSTATTVVTPGPEATEGTANIEPTETTATTASTTNAKARFQYPPGRPAMSEINDQFYIGCCESAHDQKMLLDNNITAMVSLDNSWHALWSMRTYRVFPHQQHLFVPCLDSTTQDLLALLPDICAFIDRMLAMGTLPKALPAEEWKAITPRVLVHCWKGVSRSASVVIAYLMRQTGKPLEEVLAQVKEKRRVRPSANFMEQLRVWAEVGYEIIFDL